MIVSPGSDFPFLAGFDLECSVAPEIYLNASAPLPAGIDPEARGLVARVVEIYSGSVLAIVDTARVIDGRMATSSPPCQGIVQRIGRYGMYLNENQKMHMGQALMSMVAPVNRPYVVTPYIPVTQEDDVVTWNYLYDLSELRYRETLAGITGAVGTAMTQEIVSEAFHQTYEQILPAGRSK